MGIVQESDPDRAWEALASPLRAEIALFLGGAGEASVAEIAEATDRPADGLYHHIHKLEASGIVVRCGSRHGVRRDEALYRLTDRARRMRPAPGDAPRFARMAGVLGKHAIGVLESAIAKDAAQLGSRIRFRAEFARLTEQEQDRISELYDEVLEIFAGARGRRHGGVRTAGLLLLAPEDSTPSARRRGGEQTAKSIEKGDP